MPEPFVHLDAALRGLPETLLVGVSSGIDSMALLYAIVQTGRKPVVIHFDHGWRVEGRAEAQLVKAAAAQMGLKFAQGKMKVTPQRNETEARAARYTFFARIALKLKIPDLVLAHHADDQVETFLLQLLRGGGASARGMTASSQRDGLVLHRPWLGIWKKEIAAYAKQHKLTWREDATNADTRHRRNLVRHRVLPYLQKQIGKQVADNLLRAAEIQRAESEWLDALCVEASAQSELSVNVLRASPLAQQRRTILRWLQTRGTADISFADVEAIRGLLENRIPAKVNLSKGQFARRRSGKIFIE